MYVSLTPNKKYFKQNNTLIRCFVFPGSIYIWYNGGLAGRLILRQNNFHYTLLFSIPFTDHL